LYAAWCCPQPWQNLGGWSKHAAKSCDLVDGRTSLLDACRGGSKGRRVDRARTHLSERHRQRWRMGRLKRTRQEKCQHAPHHVEGARRHLERPIRFLSG
jgi:hypothetical protein